jgi:2-hydroxy-6-oxonona-2,4-dienedioate hydrolase
MFRGLGVVARPARAAARSGRAAASSEAKAVVDGVLGSSLPEAAGRTLAEHRVFERVVSEFAGTALADDREEMLEQLAARMLESPYLESVVADGTAGRLVEPIVEQVLQSPAFKRTLLDIVGSPEVRHALANQTAGFGAEVTAAMRAKAAAADDAVDDRVRRMVHARPLEAASPFGGFVSRALAFVLDLVLSQLVFVLFSASLTLVASLAGTPLSTAVAATAAGAAWVVVAGLYFVVFWTVVGQTPGMRLLGMRITRDGSPPSFTRACARFVGLLISIALAFLGFLTIFVDRRRRALHDIIAGTVVIRLRPPALDAPDDNAGEPVAGGRRPHMSLVRRSSTLGSVWTDIDGVRVHSVLGGNGPPAVLLHGYAMSSASMLPLARALASTCSVYVPDLPGHGKSARPPRPLGIEAMADVLDAWLAASGVQAPVVVANSLGCQVATMLALKRELGPLVLVGPTVDPAKRTARRQLFGCLRDAVHEPLTLVALAAHSEGTRDVGQLLAAARSALADRMEERLPLIEQPAVVVHSDDDGFVRRDGAEQVAALLPNSRLVVVPGDAHAVHFTQPDLVADLVQDLLVLREDRGSNVAWTRASVAVAAAT